MNAPIKSNGVNFDTLEVGFDVPALPGMDEADIQTPCLILDLDALERNIRKMGDYARAHGMRHRAHGKMHKSVDVLKLQESLGGAVGVCCQKVSEAEVFVRGGIKDVLVSNQVRDPLKIDRLARLPKLGSRIIVCVDDVANVADLSAAAQRHGTTIECFVEIDCGAGRCGVKTTPEVVEIAKAVDAAPGLKFTGIQAYQGAMQHMDSYEDRKAKLDAAIAQVKDAVEALKAAGLEPELVSGGGTGSYYFESNSGVYNELQCGSYAFMDADYGRIHDAEGKRIDQGEWENALFILTSVMSHAKPDKAIVDAGLKAQSVDSGLPFVYGRDDVKYVKCSDEHGVVDDPQGVLKVNDKLRLVPGHCDPTCNVHDWYVGVRNGKVETLWPVSARGEGLLMWVVPEGEIAGLMTPEAAFDAVEAVFAAMARGDARNFPVVREALGHEDALYGFKGGFDGAGLTLGLKAGGYCPNNASHGLINHQSTVFLFDPDTGRVSAAVGGNLLTALRTAAASAVSSKYLAPQGARVLGMIGAGHQSAFQMRAAVRFGAFEKVIGWNPHPEMLSRLADTATELGLPFEAVDLPQLGAEADVIISITSAFEPLLMDGHVQGPTHIAAMGTDTKGKQELDPALVARARLFTDEIAQSLSIGEFQHASARKLISDSDVTAIGQVIIGNHPGRGDAEVTIFDGTGVGLQDLAVAAAVLELAKQQGKAAKVEI